MKNNKESEEKVNNNMREYLRIKSHMSRSNKLKLKNTLNKHYRLIINHTKHNNNNNKVI